MIALIVLERKRQSDSNAARTLNSVVFVDGCVAKPCTVAPTPLSNFVQSQPWLALLFLSLSSLNVTIPRTLTHVVSEEHSMSSARPHRRRLAYPTTAKSYESNHGSATQTKIIHHYLLTYQTSPRGQGQVQPPLRWDPQRELSVRQLGQRRFVG